PMTNKQKECLRQEWITPRSTVALIWAFGARPTSRTAEPSSRNPHAQRRSHKKCCLQLQQKTLYGVTPKSTKR
ncbi:hypothetical protein NDU88_004621, partial [Pleurodeles waltl]